MRRKGISLLIIFVGLFALLLHTGYSDLRKVPTILVCPKTMAGSSFWLTVKAGAYAAGKEAGVKIIWKGPAVETDIAGQIAIIEDYCNKKVDAIVLAACDIKALNAPVTKAIKASIPVITFDSGLDPDPTLSLVATDNLRGGKLAGEVLAKLIDKKGQVALIPYFSGAETSMLREQGFKEAIAKFPNIKLVATQYSESDVAKAMAVTENILTANPNLSGIFAENEPGAIGASQALRARNLMVKIKLVAFDASPGEIQMLQNGTIQALIVQNPYKMGYMAVKACADTLQGRIVPKRIDTGVTVVNMDNFYEPQIQKLLYPVTK